MIQSEISPTVFSRPRNDAPWWVLPIITFFSGFAIPFAVLMTVNATPEFQRGYQSGFADGRKVHEAELRATFESGVKAGRATP